MAVVYSDNFTGTTVNPFWNDNSGVAQAGGVMTINAGGAYLGASGKSAAAYRELRWRVTAGDRPGYKLYASGTEIMSITAVPASNSIDVSLRTVSRGAWPYTGTHTYWRTEIGVNTITFYSSADGSTWTHVGQLTDASAAEIGTVYVNAAGGGIGTGTSRVATVIDDFLWQDYVPVLPLIALPDCLLDDGNRADEATLSNGGLWTTPGFRDGHAAGSLASRRLKGTTASSSAMTVPTFTGPMACAASVVANPATAEATLFAHCTMTAGDGSPSKSGYVWWVDAVSEFYLGRFDPDNVFNGLAHAAMPGGALAVGDWIGLVIDRGTVYGCVRRVGDVWRIVASAADATYTSGSCGLGFVNGVEYGGFAAAPLARALIY